MMELDEAAGPTARLPSPRVPADRQSLTWSRVALSHNSCVPPPRSGAASVVVRGKLFMFGVRTILLPVSVCPLYRFVSLIVVDISNWIVGCGQVSALLA
jgi:hypothetical protein